MKQIVSNNSIYKRLSDLGFEGMRAIARPTNPIPGIGGFIFDIRLKETFSRQSEITDHMLENNTAVHDHISLQPNKITVSGRVGELVLAGHSYQPTSDAVNMLPGIQTLSPSIDKGDGAISALQEAVNKVASTTAYGQFENSGAVIEAGYRQVSAFSYLTQLQNARMLMTVETPWGIFTDMAIESLSISQEEDTIEKSTIEISFKQLSFAGTSTEVSGQLFVREKKAQQQQARSSTATGNPTQATKEENATAAKRYNRLRTRTRTK